jgi:hypothetical protein
MRVGAPPRPACGEGGGCGLVGAVFWTAEMNIDCDGQATAQCTIDIDAVYRLH